MSKLDVKLIPNRNKIYPEDERKLNFFEFGSTRFSIQLIDGT